MSNRESFIPLLIDEGPAFHSRLAEHLGLVDVRQATERITAEWLRERVADQPQAARRALALAGYIDWPNATREERAAYALRRLVFAMRARAS